MEGTIPNTPDFVLKMKGLQYLSNDSPVLLSKIEEIIALAYHPNLLEANFDVTNLGISLDSAAKLFLLHYQKIGKYHFIFSITTDNHHSEIHIRGQNKKAQTCLIF